MSNPHESDAQRRERWARERAEGERRERALADSLVGGRISGVIYDSEHTAHIVLSDGRALVVMCDPEGNGPGALHIYREPGAFAGIVGGR